MLVSESCHTFLSLSPRSQPSNMTTFQKSETEKCCLNWIAMCFTSYQKVHVHGND